MPLGLLLLLFAAVQAPPATPCNVTRPGQGDQWFGNAALRVGLWSDGRVVFRPRGPGLVLKDGSLSMKFPWERQVQGRLTIDGRRLDAPARPLQANIPDGYGDSGFQATALIFPTPGCWEVTGHVGQASLIFTTEVVKIGDGPGPR